MMQMRIARSAQSNESLATFASRDRPPCASIRPAPLGRCSFGAGRRKPPCPQELELQAAPLPVLCAVLALVLCASVCSCSRGVLWCCAEAVRWPSPRAEAQRLATVPLFKVDRLSSACAPSPTDPPLRIRAQPGRRASFVLHIPGATSAKIHVLGLMGRRGATFMGPWRSGRGRTPLKKKTNPFIFNSRPTTGMHTS